MGQIIKFEAAITIALQTLLENKHLYQSVEINDDWAEVVVKILAARLKATGRNASFDDTMSEVKKVTSLFWQIRSEAQTIPPLPNPHCDVSYPPPRLNLPTLHLFCGYCHELWPFNPLLEDSVTLGSVVHREKTLQWFCLTYQCQSCKGLPCKFFVKREGLKLRLVGRDPMAIVPTDKVLPKSVNKYFSDATIAHQAGQTLAGLFLLRVFVEQFWRTIPVVNERLSTEPRLSGDALGTAYNETLPSDFKARFPSLTQIYSDLSAAMHSATADAVLFERATKDIEKHFRAREMFELDGAASKRSGG